MSRPRTMTVLVDELAIEDGAISPPEVGAVTSFPLLFLENISGTAGVTTIQATLDPSRRPPTSRRAGQDGAERWHWSGLLRGDGWTASWHGTRPLTGPVELTGQFHGVLGIDASGAVRGRVTRVQVVSQYQALATARPNSWKLLQDRESEYREVDKSPRFFIDERRDKEGPAQRRVEIGVLIDLDLDDVPERPPRPRLVAGDVSSNGRNVWVLDNLLPKVVHIDEHRVATEHLIPGDVRPSRRVWATPSGCWISGPDGTYRVTNGHPPRHVNEHLTTAGAALGEAFLACTPNSPWQIHTPGHDPVELEVPEGPAVTAATDGETFVVAQRYAQQFRGGRNTRDYRLIRITLAGDITVGPTLPPTRGHDEPSFVGRHPLAVLQGATVTHVAPDLSAQTVTDMPRRFFNGGTASDRIWAIGHPPDGTARWWPLKGPDEYDRSRGQFWLLTLLDAATLEPVHHAPVTASSLAVAVDSAGAIWVAVGGVLHTLGEEAMQWPNVFDVNDRLEEDPPHRHPTNGGPNPKCSPRVRFS